MKYNKLGYFYILILMLSSCKIKNQISKQSFGGTFGSSALSVSKHSDSIDDHLDSIAIFRDNLPTAGGEGLSVAREQTVKRWRQSLILRAKTLPLISEVHANVPNAQLKSKSSNSGGGGVALIGIMLLLFVLLRKVIGLSAGWSWGIVFFILFCALLLIWGVNNA